MDISVADELVQVSCFQLRGSPWNLVLTTTLGSRVCTFSAMRFYF